MVSALSLSEAPRGPRPQEAPCGASTKTLTKTFCLQVSLGGGPRPLVGGAGAPFGARPLWPNFNLPELWAETGPFLGRIGAGWPKGAYAPGLQFVANIEWCDGFGHCMGLPTTKGNDYEVRFL